MVQVPCSLSRRPLSAALGQKVQRMTVRGFAPKNGVYLMYIAGCPVYNLGCLQCTPNRRGFATRRDIESPNTSGWCDPPARSILRLL